MIQSLDDSRLVLSAVPVGLGNPAQGFPGLTSWAIFVPPSQLPNTPVATQTKIQPQAELIFGS